MPESVNGIKNRSQEPEVRIQNKKIKDYTTECTEIILPRTHTDAH